MALGLRRNITMTLAVVITVAVSLALVGAGLLIRHQAQDMKDYYFYKVEFKDSPGLVENVRADASRWSAVTFLVRKTEISPGAPAAGRAGPG